MLAFLNFALAGERSHFMVEGGQRLPSYRINSNYSVLGFQAEATVFSGQRTAGEKAEKAVAEWQRGSGNSIQEWIYFKFLRSGSEDLRSSPVALTVHCRLSTPQCLLWAE